MSENTGINQLVTPSAALAKVVGDKPMTRPQVVAALWDYIKSNNLQDPTNKRNINANADLEVVFGKKTVDMFEMQKLIGSHLSK